MYEMGLYNLKGTLQFLYFSDHKITTSCKWQQLLFPFDISLINMLQFHNFFSEILILKTPKSTCSRYFENVKCFFSCLVTTTKKYYFPPIPPKKWTPNPPNVLPTMTSVIRKLIKFSMWLLQFPRWQEIHDMKIKPLLMTILHCQLNNEPLFVLNVTLNVSLNYWQWYIIINFLSINHLSTCQKSRIR